MRALILTPAAVVASLAAALISCSPAGRRGVLQKENADLKKTVSVAESEAALYEMAQVFATKRLQSELSASSFREAEWYLEQGRSNAALAKLIRSHQLDPDDGRAMVRAVNLLSYRNFARQLAHFDFEKRPFSVRFSPDGRRLALALEDGTARLYDAATTQPLGQPLKHEEPVHAVVFSPDGALLATESTDGVIKLWDAATGALGSVLKTGVEVKRLEFDRTGRRLLITAADKTIALWDLATRRPVFAPLQREQAVRAATLSPAAPIIATSERATVHFWKMESGESLGTLPPESEDISHLEFSQDGKKLLVVAGHDASLFDAGTRRRLVGPIRLDTTITTARLDPAGTRIYTAAEDFAVRAWSALNGEALGQPMRHRRIIREIRFNKNGALLITASYDGTARVWEAETGKPYTEPLRHLAEVETADLSPDGTMAATASQACVLRLWNIRDGRIRSQAIPTISGLDAVQRLPDREIVVSTPDDGTTLRLWDATHVQQIGADIVHGAPIMQVKLSPDGQRLLTRGQDNIIRLWDTANGQSLGQPLKATEPPERLIFSADSKRLLVVFGDSILALDLTAAALTPVELKHQARITDVALDASGARVLTGAQDGSVELWNAATGAPVWPAVKYNERISSVRFAPEGDLLLVTCYDGTARLLDAATSEAVGNPMRHYGPVLDANFSHDGQTIVTGGTDGTARLWETATAQSIGVPMQHDESVWRVRLDASGRWLQTEVGDAPPELVTRLWEAEKQSPANVPPGVVLTVDFDARETRVLAGFSEGKTLLLHAGTGRVAGLPLMHEGALSSAIFTADGRGIMTTSWDATARFWHTDTGAPLTDSIEHDEPVTGGELSLDGERLITLESERQVRIWELGPIHEPPPDWFAPLAEAVCGQTVDDDGSIQPVDYDRAAALEEIRQQLAASPETDPWTKWGRWFLDDRTKRTISPLATITLPQYIQKLVEKNTLESLQEAGQLAAGDMVLTNIINLRRTVLRAEVAQ